MAFDPIGPELLGVPLPPDALPSGPADALPTGSLPTSPMPPMPSGPVGMPPLPSGPLTMTRSPMGPAMPQPPAGGGFDWKQMLLQALPALVAMKSGGQDPGYTGAFMSGLAQAMQHGQAQQRQMQEKAQERQAHSGQFVIEAMHELQQLADSGADPATFASWVKTFEDVGQQAFGMKPGSIADTVTYPKNSGVKKLRDQASAAVERITKNTDPQILTSNPWVNFNGQQIKFSDLQQLAGLGLSNEKGQPILPQPQDKPVTDRFDRLLQKKINGENYSRQQQGLPKMNPAEESAFADAYNAKYDEQNRKPPTESIKPGDQTDWVTRGRRMAVAANGGQPLTDAQLQDVDAKAIAASKAAGKDPDMETMRKALMGLQLQIAGLNVSEKKSELTGGAGTAFDAERPEPATANIADPKIGGLTPNGLYQNAIQFALTGRMPAMGMGSRASSQLVRKAIQNKAGALIAASGSDIGQLQAEYRANSGTLAKLLPQAQATANYANTANDSIALALQQSPKVTRTDSAWVNSIANAFVKGATPAANLSKFETYIYTAAREYAKVTSGGALSAQGLTDSASREASRLLNAAQSPEAFAAVTQAMQDDMNKVIKRQTEGIAKVSGTLGSFFGTVHGVGPVSGATSQAPPPGSGDATSSALSILEARRKKKQGT